VRFPYRLAKTVALEGSAVHLEYQATNDSNYDLDFIWAAHPLFCASPGMQLVTPRGMDRVVNSVAGVRLGSFGKTYAFPLATLDDGSRLDLAMVPPRNSAQTCTSPVGPRTIRTEVATPTSWSGPWAKTCC